MRGGPPGDLPGELPGGLPGNLPGKPGGRDRSLRRSRIGLYGPFAVLAVLAIAWTAAWFVIRDRTRAGIDEWVGAEAASGRRWSCADRAFGGYPFRLEVRCANLTVERPDVHVSLGRLLVVSQVYRPRHVIAEASGPLRIEAGPTRVDGRWRLLQASAVTSDGGLDRLSLVVEAPTATMADPGAPPGAPPLEFSSRRFEAHLRPEPAQEGTYDLALRTDAAVIPGLDELVGGTEPADLAASLDVTQASDLPARPLWSELERWRIAGGRVNLASLTMAKGARRAEAKGAVGIDELHRPEGRLDISAAGLGGLLGRFATGSGIGGALIGAILGTPGPESRPAPRAGADAALKPLPPLRLEGGRLYVGPLPIPGVRLPVLY